MIYRWIVIIAHKFDWHHAPVIGPFEDGMYQRWCKWCGFRENFVKPGSVLWDRNIAILNSGRSGDSTEGKDSGTA